MDNILIRIALESWSVLGQMAPYLLFGFLVAGVLSVCISPEFIQRHLGGRGIGPALKASVLGVPLPLCSCGVIPVSASFRRHGASRSATVSFLLSTPQTGVDSIAITYALLGSVFAVFRPLAALATGLLGGLLVMVFAERGVNGEQPESNSATCGEACCTGRGSTGAFRRAIEYGFLILPRDIGVALLVGVVIAGTITVVAPADLWESHLGTGIVSILVAMALGAPVYVCATASVPIAAGLMLLGASPGAALAFLIAGPATNAATLTMVWKLLGSRTAALYLLTIVVSAVGGGLMLDWIIPVLGAGMPRLAAHSHEAVGGFGISGLWAVVLLAVLATSYAARSRPEIEQALQGDRPDDGRQPPEQLTLAIDGMTCGHCEATVTRALRQCHGVASVRIDRAAGRAVVGGERLEPEELVAAVRSSGYGASVVT